MSSHPNALVSIFTGLAAAVVYKYAHQLDWLNLTQAQAIVAATSATGVVLYVGRRGPVQAAAAIWQWARHGAQKPAQVDQQALVREAVAAGVADALAKTTPPAA